MSYHLYIKRDRKQDGSSSAGIALDDWLAAVEVDNEFSFIVNEGDSASAIFQGSGDFEHVVWSDGDVNAESPSAELLSKMLMLADKLDAKVIGSAGEAYPQSNLAYLKTAATARTLV